jgi:hypothetical protein
VIGTYLQLNMDVSVGSVLVCACLHYCYISCHIVVGPVTKFAKTVTRSCPCEGQKNRRC